MSWAGESSPQAFVREVERATNSRDVSAAVAVYAAKAGLETLTDGVLRRFDGLEEISAAWRRYFSAMDAAGLLVSKRLLCASDGVVVNSWEGRSSSDDRPRGIEWWRFDSAGKVRRHCLHSALKVRAIPAVTLPSGTGSGT